MTESTWKRPAKLFAVATAGLVAALTIAPSGSTGGTDNSDVPTAEGGEASGTLNISNWPLYIDGKTISEFEDQTGIKVNYNEDVKSNTTSSARCSRCLPRVTPVAGAWSW